MSKVKRKCAQRDCGMTAQGMYHCVTCCPKTKVSRTKRTK